MASPSSEMAKQHPSTIEMLTKRAFLERAQEGDITSFRYTPNHRGFIFLQICAAGQLLIAAAIYWSTKFSQGYWVLLSGIFVIASGWLLYIVIRWTRFAKTSRLAFDDDFFYVVSSQKVAQIPWAHLTVENTGFDQLAEGSKNGSLFVTLENGSVEVRLFNAFVWISDFHEIVVELLNHIKRNAGVDENDAEQKADDGNADKLDPAAAESSSDEEAEEDAALDEKP